MSLLINTISAIGNNSSVVPLLIRDCGIENPVKIGLTYKQNAKTDKKIAKEALRERTIEEYGTSAVWLGGIPLMNKIGDYFIKKQGFNPDINPKLFKENAKQGLQYNIDKFKDVAADEVKQLEKILQNKKTYENLLAGKFILSTALPIFVMGFLLPRLNFSLTDKLRKKESQQNKAQSQGQKQETKKGNVSFKGNIVSTIANLSTVNKMAITDIGLSAGRIKSARNRNEKLETAFKMSGMMLLNYVAPSWIEKGLNFVSRKIFKTNTNLDVKLLANKDFINAIKENSLEIPQEDIIDFLDKKPKAIFSKLAQSFCGVKYLKNNTRDPRSFIDEQKIKEFSDEIISFANEAKNSGDIEKFAKKAIKIKSFNTILNIGISSVLLAYCLPKLTFYLRKKFTGKENEPGLI